jgi:hypothetical protein
VSKHRRTEEGGESQAEGPWPVIAERGGYSAGDRTVSELVQDFTPPPAMVSTKPDPVFDVDYRLIEIDVLALTIELCNKHIETETALKNAAAARLAELRKSMEEPDCQLPCKDDCDLGTVHCWNHHRVNTVPGWHEPQECDDRQAGRVREPGDGQPGVRAEREHAVGTEVCPGTP